MARIKIAVLGAGNMGTALAHALAGNGHEVVVWDYFPKVVKDIRQRHENRRFLPGIRLHKGISSTSDARECVTGAALVVVSVPSAFVASTLAPVVPGLAEDAVILNVAKGFAPRTRQPLLSMMVRKAPGHPCVHLAGPAIANELARGVPTSIALASANESVARRVAGWFAGPCFIPSITTDVTGAALGGILKNVYAILLGCLEKLGGNARNLEAAALTASVREMADIASAHGGKANTLYGIAGLGDLVATGFSRDSHNRKFGQLLASGKTVAELEKQLGWLPEGVRATPVVCALARAGRVPAPLAGWVRRTLTGTRPSLDGLMRALRAATPDGRPPGPVLVPCPFPGVRKECGHRIMPDTAPPSGVQAHFQDTHWSLVLHAGDVASARRTDALEQLCQAYWRPLYAFVRRRGHDEHAAKDLTQTFFARLLEKNDIAAADAARGKFRTFLLASMNHFLANEWDKSRRLKRGGGVPILSLDDADAEARYQMEIASDWSAERVFDRRWAESMLEAVFRRFRLDVAESGDGERYEVLKPFLMGGEGANSYAEAAARLGLSETGVRSVVHRFRKRFREIVRTEIAHTVARPEDIDGEIAHLFAALAG